MAATRDIVNVANAPPAAPSFNLAGCSPATRSIREVRTRDIRKVAVEGTTGFALDAVSPAEFSSGQVTPREVTIRFGNLKNGRPALKLPAVPLSPAVRLLNFVDMAIPTSTS
jgi:hypothetical protein